MIITKGVSRFARNTLTILETVRAFKELGIDVYFEKENIHSLSEDGELLLTLLSSFAQEESLSISENCKWRIRDKFKQGISTNFTMHGYEFKNVQITIIPQEGEIIKMIFNDYLSGMGINAITRKLRDKNIKTKCDNVWQEHIVKEILENEKYTGNLLLQKSFISDHISKKQRKNNGELPKYYVEGNHEAIIYVDTFTGKIQCGICGKNICKTT